jgi:small multidrug resistance family-3 protein
MRATNQYMGDESGALGGVDPADRGYSKSNKHMQQHLSKSMLRGHFRGIIQAFYRMIGAGMTIAISLVYFLAAGLCEIGGGYLVWLWLREEKNIWLAVLGAVVLVLYGMIPTLQPANFGRVYAAYGGVFVVLSLLWGWKIDGVTPDTYDIIGGLIALVGVGIIMYWPR